MVGHQERLSFDTSFLIDLQRERMQRQSQGPAHRFLQARADATVAISTIVVGEFSEGFVDAGDPLLRTIIEAHELLAIDAAVAAVYAKIARVLRARGTLIGANDLWIGATALAHGLPVVTANIEHFSRIDGLRVVGYRG